MDFGNILDEWDSQEKQQSKKNKKNDAVPVRSGLSLKCNAGEKKKIEQTDCIQNENILSGNESKPNSSKNLSSNNSTQKKAVNQKANPMDIWLRRYGVQDKDAVEEERLKKEHLEDREYLRSLTPEARIDLHGLVRDEAWSRLDLFITECVKRGLRKVLIIHGKGNHSAENPVLDVMVRTFIEKDSRLGASGHPDKALGGKGATWVIIRQNEWSL